MKQEELEELASLYAVGALDESDSARFESEWEKRKEELNSDEMISEQALLPLISAAISEQKKPSAHVKTEMMKKLKSKRRTEAELPAVPAGFSFKFQAESQWKSFDNIPGIEYQNLAYNHSKGYLTTLVKMHAGTTLPQHDHVSAEECYVLSGDLHAFGRKMGPGDFLHADADTHHEPLFTENGCTVLLVYDPVDLLPTKVKTNRIFKPILQKIFG